MKALALALALLAAPQDASRLEPRLHLAPAGAEVGEAVRLSLELEHPARLAVTLDAKALLTDGSWLVLASEPPLSVPIPARPGWARTRAAFELASLEPGERAVPALALALAEPGSEERVELPAAGAKLSVRGLLPEGDAPVPQAKGFLDVGAEPGGRSPAWLLVPLSVLALAAARVFHARRRKRAVPSAPPDALERIDALSRGALSTPADVQAAYVEASRLLRELVDQRARRSRSGLTDSEWLQSAGAGLDPVLRARLEALLLSSTEVRYGPLRPTLFAARAHLQEAHDVLRALESPSAPAAGGPGGLAA